MYATMQSAPMSMPSAAPIKTDDQPFDFESWLKKALLGGQSQESIDPNTSNLLRSLLGQQTNGQTI